MASSLLLSGTGHMDRSFLHGGHVAGLHATHRTGQRQHQQKHDGVLPQGDLNGVDTAAAPAVEHGQTREGQARQQPPEQADGAAVAKVEGRGDQDQPEGDQGEQRAFTGADALAKDQHIEQGDEGWKAGKAERGNRHAAHLHGQKEGDPVNGQKDAAGQQDTNVAGAEGTHHRAPLQQCQHQEGNGGKARATGGDGGGGEVNERPEDAGHAEQHGRHVGNDQRPAWRGGGGSVQTGRWHAGLSPAGRKTLCPRGPCRLVPPPRRGCAGGEWAICSRRGV